MLPTHDAKGKVFAEISSINLVSSVNNTQLRVKFYGGNLIVEIQTPNGWMGFTTNSLEDMVLIEGGIHRAIKAVQKGTI